jgi:molecular chaperone HtpG
MAEQAQSYQFQAEIQQLLDILTHSLYTHRDIYIRELISNSADALDKVRYKTVTGQEVMNPELNLDIRIELDDKKNTFIIKDTGIGMTKDELIENIGTIARSGTGEFIKQMTQDDKKDINLIGRFGVGFYSVFMVAEKVEITSRSATSGEPAWNWISDGKGSFEITEGPQDAPRGTTIKVFLKEEAKDFAQKWQVESAIKKYSNFVPFPILVDNEQINTLNAIWREPKSSVKDEQYNEFFKFIANENEDPLTRLHISADVPIQFHALLYIPKTNRETMGFGKDEEGVNLFVRRVMVDSHAKDIMPDYMRFIRGVVDSDDLPLNISRETLQENPYLIKIKNTLVSKMLSHLKELQEKDWDTFKQIWKAHGRILKEGYMDFGNKDKLADIFVFDSSHRKSDEPLVSLKTYVNRMKENQDAIYFLSGQNREALDTNPSAEIFRSKGIEVLYCYDPVDEFALPGLMEYDKKKIISTDQADIKDIEKIKGDEKEQEKEPEPEKADKKELKNLARRIKDILGDKIEDVVLSERLVDSPALLKGTAPGMSSQMEKIMRMWDENAPQSKKVMEINGKHPLILDMLKIYQKDVKDPFLDKIAWRLYDSVMLLDGMLNDPHAMATGLQDLLTQSTQLYTRESKENI